MEKDVSMVVEGSDERGDGVPDNHGDARGILEKARNYSSDRVARVFWQR
jgi:hypothetical protein